jgi:hypothetical protein
MTVLERLISAREDRRCTPQGLPAIHQVGVKKPSHAALSNLNSLHFLVPFPKPAEEEYFDHWQEQAHLMLEVTVSATPRRNDDRSWNALKHLM